MACILFATNTARLRPKSNFGNRLPPFARTRLQWSEELLLRILVYVLIFYSLDLSNLQKLAKKLTKDHLVSDLIPTFAAMSQDDQDSVRLLLVDSLISIAGMFTEDENERYTVSVLRAFCNDKSWRVRYMVADKFVPVCFFKAMFLILI